MNPVLVHRTLIPKKSCLGDKLLDVVVFICLVEPEAMLRADWRAWRIRGLAMHAQRQHTAWKFPSKSLSNTWPRVSYLGFLFQWNNLRLFDKTSHDAQGLLTFKKHIEFSTSRTTSDQRDKHSEHELVPTSKRNLEPKLCYLMYGLTGRQHWNGYQFQTRNGIDKR